MKKSSIPAILIWILYGLTAGCCTFLTAMTISAELGYGSVKGLAAGAVVLAGLGLVTYMIGRLKKTKEVRECNDKKQLGGVVAESLLLIVLMVLMVLYRAAMPQDGDFWKVAADPIYEQVQVTAGSSVPGFAHGGMDIYVKLLKACVFLIGNRPVAAVALQLALLVFAVFGLYFGVRRSGGRLAALVTVAFLGFAPYMLVETCSLSSFLLVLGVFGFALDSVASVPGKTADGRLAAGIHYVVTGALVGFCCYLDLSGIVLLVFLTGNICFGRDERENGPEENSVVIFVINLILAFAGYVASHWVHSLVAGCSFVSSVNDQLGLFLPGRFAFPVTIDLGVVLWDVPLLAALMALGIFSYWVTHRIKSKGIWLFAAALLMVMQCFAMNETTCFDSYALLYLFCVVMAGISVEDLVVPKISDHAGVQETDAVHAQDNVFREAEDTQTTVQEDTQATVQEAAVQESSAVQYIENPLPLPKKHAHKVMDYDYEVADDDDFDIP